ncbi:hypothetical protein McpSp1_13720 [Methanocorpusculaceae archaeon Sp1]|nr:hypothetical protein [Methanocorpusculaceae archaeon Sp1]
MFGKRTKWILYAILILGSLIMATPLRSYEAFAGSSPELSLLTYCFGLLIGFAVMFAAFLLDVRETKDIKPVVLKKSGIAILTSILLIFAGIVVWVAYLLSSYMPEKIGFSSLSYIIGLAIGFTAVAIIYYLPNELLYEEQQI